MIAKEELFDIELAVHASRHEAGSGALYAWLRQREVDLNTRWSQLEGEDLTRLQGEARLVARMLKLLVHGPALKPKPAQEARYD